MTFWTYLREHRSRYIGLAVGFVLPVLWWTVGFWRTLLWLFCMAVGYLVGRIIEQPEWFYKAMEKILPRKED
jgi:uncharacterized membrane protein